MKDQSKNFYENLIFTEIEGKNTAIHAYDKIIWQVRLGFLTLVFGGWTLIIESAIENGKTFDSVKEYFVFMSTLSIITSIGAFAIDKKYVKNKFRVVVSLTEVQTKLLKIKWEGDIDAEKMSEIVDNIGVVGDSGSLNFKGEGYDSEMTVVRWTYLTTLLASVFVIVYSL